MQSSYTAISESQMNKPEATVARQHEEETL